MNKILGSRDSEGLDSKGLTVYVDGKEVPLKPSLKVFNHSPSGFEAGYEGSGPAQLALAILMLFTDNQTAVRLHQTFKREVLSDPQYFESPSFQIEIDIPEWIENNKPFEEPTPLGEPTNDEIEQMLKDGEENPLRQWIRSSKAENNKA